MNVHPLADRVVVQPIDPAAMTPSGLHIPDVARERPQEGKVLAVGPGRYENGVLVTTGLHVGQHVLYGKYSGTEIEVDGEEVFIVRESDILAVVG